MPSLVELGLSNALGAAVLGAVVTVVTRLWRRPALASALWVLVLVKLVAPPMPWALVPRRVESRPQVPVKQITADPKTGRSVAASGVARRRVAKSARSAQRPKATPGISRPRPVLNTRAPLDWTKVTGAYAGWLPQIWGAGGLLWLGLACLRLRRFGRLLRHARPAPEFLCLKVTALARRMGLRRCPELRVTEATVPPLVWIVTRRPIIALPAALLRRLSCEQQETLVAHELAHLRRRDHWAAWLELVVLALYWWHPMVWWARRELHRAQEACCDGWVVWALPEAAVAYAKALLDTVDFLSDLRPAAPPAANAFGEAHSLRRRLEMILHERIAHRLSWPVGLGLVLIVLPMVLWAPAVRQAKADVDAGEGQLAASVDDLDQRISRLEKAVALLVNELRELRGTLEHSPEQMQTPDEEQVPEKGEISPAFDAEVAEEEVAEEMEPQESEHEANEPDEDDVPDRDAEHEDGDDEDHDGDDHDGEESDEILGTLSSPPQPRLVELIREHKRLRQRLIEIEDELEEELGRRLDK